MEEVTFYGVNFLNMDEDKMYDNTKLQSDTLKILHFASAFFPEYSGTATRLYGLLSNLPYDISLITVDRTIKGDIIELKEEYFNNIKVKRVSLQPNNVFSRVPLRYIHTIYQKPKILVNAAKSEQFDIIHAHNLSLFAQAARKLSIKLSKPFIIEVHVIGQDYQYGVKRNIKTGYIDRGGRKSLKFCNCIIALTQGLKNWISAYYNIQEDKIVVVPNGADINKFAPKYENKAEEIKERLGLLDNVVLYAGYMDRINGIIDIANVIPSMITKNPDTSFIFIGHGPEEDKIIALSKKYPQVKFLPMVHYDEMPIYYQMCDLFVIPRPSTISAETVTPLKLLEVMAMEKPVLGSNVGGIAEVIKHGENGYLFEKGNMESFKRTLLELLDTDNTQIGRNARKTIVDNYTWAKSAKILQKVYEELV
jgi:glycosyltransferase involved in cell wall biosynthesis